MAAKSAVNPPCCPEEKSVAKPLVSPEEAAGEEEEMGCKIPPADGGKLEWAKEEELLPTGWRRPLPLPAAGAAAEGCSSPLEAGVIDAREEPGLGCRPVKDELPWREVAPVGTGFSSPALPPLGMEVWSKLAAEVGGAEREERALEAANQGSGLKKTQKKETR